MNTQEVSPNSSPAKRPMEKVQESEEDELKCEVEVEGRRESLKLGLSPTVVIDLQPMTPEEGSPRNSHSSPHQWSRNQRLLQHQESAGDDFDFECDHELPTATDLSEALKLRFSEPLTPNDFPASGEIGT